MRKEEKELAGRDAGMGDEVPSDDELAELGAVLGGNENNPNNVEKEKVDISDVQEKNDVPELGNYEKIHG